jgi:integrase
MMVAILVANREAERMITIRNVEGLAPGQVIWDSKLPGFGARRQREAVAYVLKYRVNGRQRFITLGRHGALTPDQARRKAKAFLGSVASGTDPAAPKGETFGAIVPEYLAYARKSLRPSSYNRAESYLQQSWEMLHSIPLANITRRDVAKGLAEIGAGHSASVADRARAALSAMMNWALREGHELPSNPVLGTNKPATSKARQRVLTNAELAQLWRATGDGSDFSRIIRLLMLTGQRRDEIGRLQWPELDLDRAVIVLPPTRTKNHREHIVPLVPLALSTLPPKRRETYVFGNGVGFSAWSLAKGRLDAKANLKPYRLHDIRRSVATGMGEIGILPHIIEAILNHISGHKAGIAGVYNKARYLGEMRAALERWAAHIESLVNAR